MSCSYDEQKAFCRNPHLARIKTLTVLTLTKNLFTFLLFQWPKSNIINILTRISRQWCIYASAPRPLWVDSALIRARSVLPPHLSANLVLPGPPNEPLTRKTIGICRARLPPCSCINGAFRAMYFARARAKGKKIEPTCSVYSATATKSKIFTPFF